MKKSKPKKLNEYLTPIVLFALFALLSFFNTFEKQENSAYDAILQSPREADQKVLIIGMDDYSIEQYGQWPWPRSYMAEVIDKLTELGVAAIGIDVLYDTYGSIPENDMLLVSAAENSGRVTFASMAVFDDGVHKSELNADDYIEPFPELKAVSKTAHINFIPDSTKGLSLGSSSDGVIRRALAEVVYDGERVKAFPISIYETYCQNVGIDDTLEIPTDRFSRFYIDFVGRPYSFPMLSFASVLDDEYPPEIFENAIALVGPYAVGIGKDHYYTPLDAQAPMYGIEIHANVIQNLLEKNFKSPAGAFLDLFWLFVWGMVAFVAFKRFSPQVSAFLAILLILCELAAGRFVYNTFDLIFQIFYPAVFVFTLYVVNLAASFLLSQNEKRQVTDLFGRFVAPEVVNEIISGGVSVELGGSLREVSVLFVDIRGFTTFSEVTPPATVVSILNEYLELTTNSILKNKGTLDKFIGDATMAVFNAPNKLEEHALHAVKAACAMQEGAKPLQEKILEEYGVTLRFGIGVNTGSAIVGNIGSKFRMDYTVIGDTVNTAARLESNAKPNEILISKAVYDRVSDKVDAECLGNITVKGKKTELLVYRVDGIRGEQHEA